jgi:hypothetical protein
MVNLEIRPSTVNLLELAKHPHTGKRKALFKVMGALLAGGPLLPWPFKLLQEVGQSVLKGGGGFRIEYTGFEYITERPFAVARRDLAKARRFMDALEATFNQVHDRGRPMVQRFLKERGGLRDPWGDPGTFLDHQWTTVQQLDTLVQAIWTQLGLPGAAPVQAALSNPAFRLFFEGLGVAVYERAVKVQQPRRVQHADLLQLPYLGGSHAGIIVTRDESFYRVASAILDARHANRRAMRWEDFADVG